MNVFGLYIGCVLTLSFFSLAFFVRTHSRDFWKIKNECRSWSVTWVFFAQFIWVLIVIGFGLTLLFPYLKNVSEGFAIPREVLGAFLTQGCISMLVLILLLKVPSFQEGFSFKKIGTRKVIGLGIYAFLACLLPVIVVNYGWRMLLLTFEIWGFELGTDPQIMVKILSQNPSMGVMVMIALPALVLAPLNEEAIFRGGIYRFLKGKLSPVWAAILSALLFGFMHYNVASILPLFCLGLFFCYVYERTGNLWVNIVFHSLFNLNTYILILLKNA